MLNLIHMNLYRMAKTKSLWSCMLSMVFFCIFSCYMVSIDYEMHHAPNAQTAGQENEQSGIVGVYEGADAGEPESTFGITVQVPEKENGEMPAFLEFYNSDLASGIILLFLSIGCVIYFNGEQKSGFLKNIAGQTRHKSSIFLSKIVANMLYILVALLIYGVTQFIALQLILKGYGPIRFGTEYLSETFLLLLANFVLYLAFLGGISLITTVTKSTAVGITVGIMAACGLPATFGVYMEKLLHVTIIKYLVTTNMHQLLIGAPQKNVLFALGTGIISAAVYYFLATVYFTRKDIV